MADCRDIEASIKSGSLRVITREMYEEWQAYNNLMASKLSGRLIELLDLYRNSYNETCGQALHIRQSSYTE